MEFIPLHFGDRLTVINPQGTIGVVTLWSKVDYVIERFRQAGVDLDPATSPIAVFGTLYGNGLREMLRNLLYNPQIQTLLICGNDRSGSWEELRKFFSIGPGAGGSLLGAIPVPHHGIKVAPARIRETRRIIDDLVKPEQFSHDSGAYLVQATTNEEQPRDGHVQEIFSHSETWSPLTRLKSASKMPLPKLKSNISPATPGAMWWCRILS